MNHTRTKRHKQRRTRKNDKVQHHHLLLRMETQKCPNETDKQTAKQLIKKIIRDVDMNLLGEPRAFYVSTPLDKQGLTAMAPIQTSHIAFHFWSHPDKPILFNKSSKCLLEFDLYTCGSLRLKDIQHILHHLSCFEPTHIDLTVLNRNRSLKIERTIKWNLTAQSPSWQDFIKKLKH